jgi:hypothetical protein
MLKDGRERSAGSLNRKYCESECQLRPFRLYVASVGESNHIIAVGGAGSSGLPALSSGTKIITNARPTSTTRPAA